MLWRVDSTESFIERSENPSKEDIETVRKLSPRSYRIARAFIILLAVWGFLTIFLAIAYAIFPYWNVFRRNDVYRPETLPPGLNDCLCGHTKEEALLLDCAYDSLSTAWLPRACRDDALTDKFDHAGPGPRGAWDYYLDSNGTILLSKAEVAELGPKGGTFWASADWHVAHCAFYFQKYKRIGQTGVIMEARYDNLPHVEHCGKLIMNDGPDYFYLIEVPVRMNGSIQVGPTAPTRIGGKIKNLLG
jgi:hypothetical protein